MLTTKSMLSLLRKYVDQEKTIMMTDEARFHNGFDEAVQHLVTKHKEKYVAGVIQIPLRGIGALLRTQYEANTML